MTRMTRAPAGEALLQLANRHPGGDGDDQVRRRDKPRTSASKSFTHPGLTATTITPANFARLDIGLRGPGAGLPRKHRPRRLRRVGGQDLAGLTSPPDIKPLASAAAILPAPKNPMVSSADMTCLITGVSARKRFLF